MQSIEQAAHTGGHWSVDAALERGPQHLPLIRRESGNRRKMVISNASAPKTCVKQSDRGAARLAHCSFAPGQTEMRADARRDASQPGT